MSLEIFCWKLKKLRKNFWGKSFFWKLKKLRKIFFGKLKKLRELKKLKDVCAGVYIMGQAEHSSLFLPFYYPFTPLLLPFFSLPLNQNSLLSRRKDRAIRLRFSHTLAFSAKKFLLATQPALSSCQIVILSLRKNGMKKTHKNNKYIYLLFLCPNSLPEILNDKMTIDKMTTCGSAMRELRITRCHRWLLLLRDAIRCRFITNKGGIMHFIAEIHKIGISFSYLCTLILKSIISES